MIPSQLQIHCKIPNTWLQIHCKIPNTWLLPQSHRSHQSRPASLWSTRGSLNSPGEESFWKSPFVKKGVWGERPFYKVAWYDEHCTWWTVFVTTILIIWGFTNSSWAQTDHLHLTLSVNYYGKDHGGDGDNNNDYDKNYDASDDDNTWGIWLRTAWVTQM